ncbi:alpha/beta fold hydrolase [Mesorhizobium sp. BR1-1-2]|uniref:alpha/beta fold hydrolase n=1 Tax=Mesorhizobium sp. BR1-1-2 TaxID=2876652 RepID=UPI001CCEFBD5|nr:alpha/beta fold hydrolase [Mesorhizobium sp. BR1-1-2]MBZ9967357.1 alpha/beta fold hydrolase [Mesorhizobium sp. BR1-1-2]
MTKTGRPDIISEAFGDPADPALLLIMGAMASMLWWPEALCRKLAGAGLFVLRYDNRDTGRSTKYPPGEPPYTFDDMADDAIGVLDSHGLDKAHIAGMSMGGMIAQLVALKHPSRVASLTVISSSPLGVDTSNLPQTSDAYIEHSAEGAHIDWSDRRQVIDFMIKDTRAIASTAHPFDEGRMRAFIDRLRPEGRTDPFGVEQARDQLRNSYAIIEQEMASRTWAVGDAFTMADCAASPALFYANKVEPFGDKYPAVKRYHDRLLQRPAFIRVIEEAQPYFKLFPYNDG